MRAFQFIYGPKVLSGTEGAARLGDCCQTGMPILQTRTSLPGLASLGSPRFVKPQK